MEEPPPQSSPVCFATGEEARAERAACANPDLWVVILPVLVLFAYAIGKHRRVKDGWKKCKRS